MPTMKDLHMLHNSVLGFVKRCNLKETSNNQQFYFNLNFVALDDMFIGECTMMFITSNTYFLK